jgi:hypothetical protein
LLSRICTGEAKIDIYEQQEGQAEKANGERGSSEAVCVRQVQTCSSLPLWTAESHAKVLPEASYLRVEAEGELGAAVMVIAASLTEAHHSLTSYASVPQQGEDGAAEPQLMLKKTEPHPAFQKVIPFTGSSWGPSEERPLLNFDCASPPCGPLSILCLKHVFTNTLYVFFFRSMSISTVKFLWASAGNFRCTVCTL